MRALMLHHVSFMHQNDFPHHLLHCMKQKILEANVVAWHDSWELSALHELALSLYLWALSQIIVYRPLYCCQWSCYKKCHIICNWQANWALLIPYKFSLSSPFCILFSISKISSVVQYCHHKSLYNICVLSYCCCIFWRQREALVMISDMSCGKILLFCGFFGEKTWTKKVVCVCWAWNVLWKIHNFLGHLNLSKKNLTLVVMLANTQTVEVCRVMHDFISFLRNFGFIVFSNLLLENTSFLAYS
jgi:hypothetical protein